METVFVSLQCEIRTLIQYVMCFKCVSSKKEISLA